MRLTVVALACAALRGAERDTLVERDRDGTWTALTNAELLRRARAVALALRERGIGPGDRVALMSPNRIDWIVANFGILFAGAVTVPIYATQALDEVRFILDDAAARLLFVDTPATAERLRAGEVTVETIVFDGSRDDDATLAALIARGTARHTSGAAALDEPAPGDLAVLIYTSGTTGTPKGVMLSHGNLASNAVDAFSLTDGVIQPGDPVLSVLPFAHIYEHTSVLGYLVRGATVYVNRHVEALLDDLRAVRPVAMFGVPRIFERMYAAMQQRAHAAGGVRARLVPWAFAIGRRYVRAGPSGPADPVLRLQFAVAYALVLRKVRPQLGCDRLRFFGSGSAALHPDIAYAFAAAGITIVEGYGLTECSPVVTANDVRKPRVGTVGRPIPNVELRLAGDGELLVRGPNVMQGYYRSPDETAAVLHDGWLATGDVATIDAAGFVRIVDRKREIFKTSGGKYVAPARVEAAILRSRFVAQAVVVGSGRAHPAALIAPNWAALDGCGDVGALLTAECIRATADLAPHEQIRWVGVLPRELTIEADELTPTLKVKRRIVEERYAGLIQQFAVAALALVLALGCAAPVRAQSTPRTLVLALSGRTAGEWPVYVGNQVGFYAANGIRPDIVVGGSTAGAEQLTAGSADVADVTATQIVEAIMGGAPLTSIFDRSRPAPNPLARKGVISITPLPAYGVNVTWARSHADLIIAFLYAYVQSVQWLYDPANKARAIDILAKETNATPDDAAKSYELYVIKAKYYTLNGTVSPERMRLAADALVKTKHLNAVPPALGIFYDNRYVAQVNSRLRIR